MMTSFAWVMGTAAVLVAALAAVAGDRPAEQDAVTAVDAAAAAKLATREDVVVLDIRTPEEFKAGHVKAARNVDFHGADFEARLKELDRAKTYLLYCRSGARSTRSLEAFRKLGFKSIQHLDKGFNAWVAAGNPVEK